MEEKLKKLYTDDFEEFKRFVSLFYEDAIEDILISQKNDSVFFLIAGHLYDCEAIITGVVGILTQIELLREFDIID